MSFPESQIRGPLDESMPSRLHRQPSTKHAELPSKCICVVLPTHPAPS